MTGTLLDQLLREPVPADPTGVAEHGVVGTPDHRWRLAWLLGTVSTPFGPTFDSARAACAASQALRQARP